MYKRILALITGPSCWDVVLGQLERLAGGREEVDVILLMVVEAPATAAVQTRNLQRQLDTYAQILRQRGIRVQTALRYGPRSQEVVSYSRAHPIDVIVMATPKLVA